MTARTIEPILAALAAGALAALFITACGGDPASSDTPPSDAQPTCDEDRHRAAGWSGTEGQDSPGTSRTSTDSDLRPGVTTSDDVNTEADANAKASECRDSDNDGYFVELTPCACPPGILLDCDDTDPHVNPGAPEVCNGVDSNCNGYVDAYGPNPEDSVCGDDEAEASN